MKTSLQAITYKAQRERRYRFRNLYTMLNRVNLDDSFHLMNRQAAPGVDGVTMRQYRRDFRSNMTRLTDLLKRKRYRPQLVRRVNIPKGNGKLRPLGLPVIADKLVQTVCARILGAIYEQDFLPCSYGYRPRRGAGRAAVDLQTSLVRGKSRWVVEADIKGFFDSIDHDWLMRMLEERVDDRAFLRLIRKWLKAGILDTDGKAVHPVTGTPQGGVISPVLANVYLHYVLDLWFEKVVKAHCAGEVYLCRYADDFVCAFQHKRDAERFYRALPRRLEKFGLRLAEEKTRLIRFSRFDQDVSDSFDFLGFEYRWLMSRNGKPYVRRRTSRKTLRAALKNVAVWAKEHRWMKMRELMPRVNAIVTGHMNYFGVIGNSTSIVMFVHHVRRILFKWLNRRSQKRSFNWDVFAEVLAFYQFPRPGLVQHMPEQHELRLT